MPSAGMLLCTSRAELARITCSATLGPPCPAFLLLLIVGLAKLMSLLAWQCICMSFSCMHQYAARAYTGSGRATGATLCHLLLLGCLLQPTHPLPQSLMLVPFPPPLRSDMTPLVGRKAPSTRLTIPNIQAKAIQAQAMHTSQAMIKQHALDT